MAKIEPKALERFLETGKGLKIKRTKPKPSDAK